MNMTCMIRTRAKVTFLFVAAFMIQFPWANLYAAEGAEEPSGSAAVVAELACQPGPQEFMLPPGAEEALVTVETDCLCFKTAEEAKRFMSEQAADSVASIIGQPSPGYSYTYFESELLSVASEEKEELTLYCYTPGEVGTYLESVTSTYTRM